jgi:hypothetical protein
VLRWADENLLELGCQEIGEHYGRYRLHLRAAERVVCRLQERYELIDGFKRLGAARTSAETGLCDGGSPLDTPNSLFQADGLPKLNLP